MVCTPFLIAGIMGEEPARSANPVQTTIFSGVKRGFPGDGIERMKNNAEITHYASYNKRMD